MTTSSTQPPPVLVATAAAEAAAATKGVARLDDGPLRSVATYGQERRVGGVRVRDGEQPAVHVHVVVTLDQPIPLVAADIRDAVAAALQHIGDPGRAVHVHITDIDTGEHEDEEEIAGELPAVTSPAQPPLEGGEGSRSDRRRAAVMKGEAVAQVPPKGGDQQGEGVAQRPTEGGDQKENR